MILLEEIKNRLENADVNWEDWNEVFEECWYATQNYNKKHWYRPVPKTGYETLIDLLKAYVFEKKAVNTFTNIHHNSSFWDEFYRKNEWNDFIKQEKYKPDFKVWDEINNKFVEVEGKSPNCRVHDYINVLNDDPSKAHGAKIIYCYDNYDKKLHVIVFSNQLQKFRLAYDVNGDAYEFDLDLSEEFRVLEESTAIKVLYQDWFINRF